MKLLLHIALLLCLVASSPMVAGELTLGAGTEGIYDSNVFGVSSGASTDFSFRLMPNIRVREDRGELQYDLKYEAGWEYFTDNEFLKGWDHDANGEMSWQITPRTRFSAQNRFRRFRSLSRFNQTVDSGGDTSASSFEERDPFNNNIARLELEERLTSKDTLSAYGSWIVWEFDRQDRRDRETILAGVQYRRLVNERLVLGGFTNWIRQHFDRTEFQPSQDTDYLNISLLANYQFTKTFRMDLSAGPALVFQDDAQESPLAAVVDEFPAQGSPPELIDGRTCPVEGGVPVFLPGLCEGSGNPQLQPPTKKLVSFQGSQASVSDVEPNFFVDVAFLKTWEHVTARLAYRRSDDRSAGIGIGSIADVAVATVTWEPIERFTIRGSGSYIRRTQEQDTAQTVIGLVVQPDGLATSDSLRSLKANREFRTDTWRGSINARYKINRRMSLYGSALYRVETNKGDAFEERDVNRFLFRIGFRYTFDPIRY